MTKIGPNSVLMALGWMVKAMEQVRDVLSAKVEAAQEPRSEAPPSSSPGRV